MKLLQSGWMLAILGVAAFGGVFFAANKFVLQKSFEGLNKKITTLEKSIDAAKEEQEKHVDENSLTTKTGISNPDQQRAEIKKDEKREKDFDEAMKKANEVTGLGAVQSSGTEARNKAEAEMKKRKQELEKRIIDLRGVEAQMYLQIKQFEESDKKMMEDKQRELEQLLKVRMDWIRVEEEAKLQQLATFWTYGITNTIERATTVVNTVMSYKEPKDVAKVMLYMKDIPRLELYTLLDGQGEEGAKLKLSIAEAFRRVTTNQPPVVPPATNAPPQP